MLTSRPSRPVNFLPPARHRHPLQYGAVVALVLLLAWLLAQYLPWSGAAATAPPTPVTTVPVPAPEPTPAPLQTFWDQLADHTRLSATADLVRLQMTPREVQLTYRLRDSDWHTPVNFWQETSWPIHTRLQRQAEGLELQLTVHWPQAPEPSLSATPAAATVPSWPAAARLLSLHQQPGQLRVTLQGDWETLTQWWQEALAAGWSAQQALWQPATNTSDLTLEVQLTSPGHALLPPWPQVDSPFSLAPNPTASPAQATTPEPAEACATPPPQVQVHLLWRAPPPARARFQVDSQPPRLAWLPEPIGPDGWQLRLNQVGQPILEHPACPRQTLPPPGQ